MGIFQGVFRNRSVWVFAKLSLVTVLLGSLFMGLYVLPARATTTTVYASADNSLIINSLDSSVGNTVYSNSDLGVGFNWEVWPLTGNSYLGFGSAIKFDIDALIGGKTINQATLKLWPYLLPTDWDTQYAVNAFTGYWNPATTTWNSAASLSYWLGGEARVNPPVTTAIPMEFDVTTIVQNWADGSWNNYGFLLRDTTLWHPGYNAWRATGIESLEYYYSSNHRPQLYLEYVGELPQVATPTFDPSSGALFTNTLDVTVSCATPSATIRYTTDGSTPTSTHGTAISSGGTFTISSSTTVKAMAYRSGYTDSNVATATYTKWVITPKVATPIFNPGGDTYSSAQSVTILCDTSEATIRYTTDGSTPTSTHGTVYSGAISVSSSMTLKAIAYKSGYLASDVATATYTINIPTDTTPPTGSVIINGGDTWTTSSTVTLTISASDPESGVTEMRIANGGEAWEPWEPYSTTKTWDLVSGENYRQVWVRFKNGVGLESSQVGDYIYVDTTPPGTPVPDDGVSGWSNDNTPTFSWDAVSDPMSGVAGYYWRVDSGGETWTTGTSVTVPAVSDGSHTFYTRAVDKAGNYGSWGSHTFQIDNTAPSAPTVSSSTHPDQDTWYYSNDTSFTWTTPADPSGIAGYSVGLSPYSFAVPDEVVDTTDNVFSYTDVEDGEWYFHVRAVDNAGNWGDKGSYRVSIDANNVVPEFATWLFFPFLISATLLGLALRKRLKKPNHLV